MRLALGIEYAGKNYSGWQHQLHVNKSVQGEVERALSGIAAHSVSVVCAGRTDAGVHASEQVIHCDVVPDRTEHEWVFGCNRLLPDDIRVLWARVVSDEFHARYSAKARHYKYIIYNNRIRPSLLGDYVCWHYHPLQVTLMSEAAKSWVGMHDFSSFRAAGCQSKTPVRHMTNITVQRQGEMIVIDVTGNAFLYHMVRNMVGVLLEVGSGRKPVVWADEVLEARDRKSAGVTAPAQGLYLVGIDYPDIANLPQGNKSLWFLEQDRIA